jgi:hypothetical protein
MAAFRLLLALAAQYGGNVHHMTVPTAFLSPKMDRRNIYTAIPLGIGWLEPNTWTRNALIIRKSLHGLKLTPRLYGNIDGFLQCKGFRQSAEDPNLYLQHVVLLLLYVDDLPIATTGAKQREREWDQVEEMKLAATGMRPWDTGFLTPICSSS